MSKINREISFEEWVTYHFDPEAAETEWYNDYDQWWDESANFLVKELEFTTRLFENPVRALATYSDTKVGQGLWDLTSPVIHDQLRVIGDETINWDDRKRCLKATFNVYNQLFTGRCSQHLSHLAEPGANPVNSICYMWWDRDSFYPRPDEPEFAKIDGVILDVLANTLSINHDACREGRAPRIGSLGVQVLRTSSRNN